MRLSSLKSPEKRARYVAKTRKSLLQFFRPAVPTRPVFIAGMQRSGTTMMMNVFHLRSDTAVYDEARDSSVFEDFRIRSVDVLRGSLSAQSLPVAVYKVICDSHQITELLDAFPDARVLWVYRNAEDNADSQLRKFANPVGAVKLVHANRPGGGWFAEGVSESTRRTLQEISADALSDFDWACLNWWARNRLFLELELAADDRVELLRYEELVVNPREVLGQVIDWLGLPHKDRSFRFVHSRSVDKKDLPDLHPRVKELCDSLMDSMNSGQRFLAGGPAG